MSVHWDFKVLAYKFAQPFGLIETLITGPLWRIMNKEMCVLGMSKHYQNLLESFEKWAVNRTSSWNDKTFCANSFFSHDKCFESLCTPVSNKVQRITKEYLEIFSGFVIFSRMLHGHLFIWKEENIQQLHMSLKKKQWLSAQGMQVQSEILECCIDWCDLNQKHYALFIKE